MLINKGKTLLEKLIPKKICGFSGLIVANISNECLIQEKESTQN